MIEEDIVVGFGESKTSWPWAPSFCCRNYRGKLQSVQVPSIQPPDLQIRAPWCDCLHTPEWV